MRAMYTKFDSASSCSSRDRDVRTNMPCSICLVNRFWLWLIMKTLHCVLGAIKPGRAAAAALDQILSAARRRRRQLMPHAACRTTWALCRSVCKVFTDRQAEGQARESQAKARRVDRVANACMEYQFIIHLWEKCAKNCGKFMCAHF